MNQNWRRKVRGRYGMVLCGSPHPQSPAMLAALCHDYSKEEHANDNYWTWLTFRDNYFKELGEAGKVCHYCKRNDLDYLADQRADNLATLDHVLALSQGGELYDKKNLVVACRKCNHSKGNKDVKDFQVELQN